MDEENTGICRTFELDESMHANEIHTLVFVFLYANL